jgi:hypothetical protein
MKVYVLYHGEVHEGPDVVAVYASRESADAEATKRNEEYTKERSRLWDSLTKREQKFYGPKTNYLTIESWDVVEYDLIP